MKKKLSIAVVMKMFFLPAAFLILCTQIIPTDAVAVTKEKTIVGEVEEVVLMPWGIKLPARIDTGARRSCLDARDIRIDGGRPFAYCDPYYEYRTVLHPHRGIRGQ